MRARLPTSSHLRGVGEEHVTEPNHSICKRKIFNTYINMSSKGTPKKFYSSTKTTFDLSSCRLSGNVVDAYYCKNIFTPENQDSLNTAIREHNCSA